MADKQTLLRVRLSGPSEVLQHVESEARSTAAVDAPFTRREDAELRLGVKEIGDIVVVVKDVAALSALLWSGLKIVRAEWSKRGTARAPASAGGTHSDLPIALDVTTATAQVRLSVPLDATREQIEAQLLTLRPPRTT